MHEHLEDIIHDHIEFFIPAISNTNIIFQSHQLKIVVLGQKIIFHTEWTK